MLKQSGTGHCPVAHTFDACYMHTTCSDKSAVPGEAVWFLQVASRAATSACQQTVGDSQFQDKLSQVPAGVYVYVSADIKA